MQVPDHSLKLAAGEKGEKLGDASRVCTLICKLEMPLWHWLLAWHKLTNHYRWSKELKTGVPTAMAGSGDLFSPTCPIPIWHSHTKTHHQGQAPTAPVAMNEAPRRPGSTWSSTLQLRPYADRQITYTKKSSACLKVLTSPCCPRGVIHVLRSFPLWLLMIQNMHFI